MMLTPFRWLAKNLSALILAFVLATVVWVAAVVTSDPNSVQTTKPIPIEQKNLGTNMLLIGEIPIFTRLTLEAPTSIWNQINSNSTLIKAWVDFSGLEAGEHTVPVNVQIDTSPVKILGIDPAEVNFVLEPLMTREIPIQLEVIGEPPLGYKKEAAVINPTSVLITGPESTVEKVDQAKATLEIAGASQTVTSSVEIKVLSSTGEPLEGLSLNPQYATVTQPISLLRGFRNVAVKVITRGQVANGYRITNITVTPPTVTVSSADPLLINEIPGFIETEAIDLTNLTDDIEVNVVLNLPEGVTMVREPSVFVQVGVAAIESSLTIPLPVEILGIPSGLEAIISPPSVNVTISGPIPVLETLSPSSFRIVIDLTNMEPGVYQISPVLDLAPSQVRIEAILPESVEVVLQTASTPTPTIITTPVAPTATPSP